MKRIILSLVAVIGLTSVAAPVMAFEPWHGRAIRAEHERVEHERIDHRREEVMRAQVRLERERLEHERWLRLHPVIDPCR
jgi:hypothetical protein